MTNEELRKKRLRKKLKRQKKLSDRVRACGSKFAVDVLQKTNKKPKGKKAISPKIVKGAESKIVWTKAVEKKKGFFRKLFDKIFRN